MGKKILLVDDSKFMRTRVKKHLIESGCEIAEAKDGQEGLEAVQLSRPDLVVSDVNMPIMDGPEFVKRLFELDPTIPVIMLTANPDRDLKFAVMDYNVKAFMSKLHTVDKLAAKIIQVLERIG